ncbi:TCR/Tet family MFS transporter [Gellertiella hungarica]|uniref:DHA1 family tetracycline resistance protein-like MFS transporter n=1 Tax=Gellertiella hungarica TaxID=1572859 RepID=A0A7W6NIL9_9HYPH|nr:TCR/Tet family MFS transporter [Gellertiella hungarica]MBB4063500.1 DHA1 family tetracycline resistance protein-like MFS transporter [Gellertiella hungarica]
MTEARYPGGAGRGRSPAFIFIFLTVLLDMLSIGIIIPVLPKLILHFTGGEFNRAAEMLGIFMSVWALMQFIASPVIGALSDRFGRRPVILASNLGLGLDYLLMALAPALWVLFVGRVLAGIFSATVSAAQAYIADITPPEKRAASFGMLGAAFGLGFVLGPAVGGILGHYDLRLPFFAAAAMSLANFLYGFFVLPESLKPELRAPFRPRSVNPATTLALLRRTPELGRLGFITFIIMLAHQVLPACAVLYMGLRYGWQEREVGFLLAGVGVAGMIVQGGLVRPVVKAIGEKKAMLLGLTAGAMGFALYGWAPTGAVFMMGVPVMALWGFAQPSVTALMTKEVSAEEQGRLQGASASLGGLSGMIGPWAFAYAFAYAVDPVNGLNLPGLPFFAASVLMVLGLAAGLGVRASLRPGPELAGSAERVE